MTAGRPEKSNVVHGPNGPYLLPFFVVLKGQIQMHLHFVSDTYDDMYTVLKIMRYFWIIKVFCEFQGLHFMLTLFLSHELSFEIPRISIILVDVIGRVLLLTWYIWHLRHERML